MAALEDNPIRFTTKPEKRQLLRNYLQAWSRFQFLEPSSENVEVIPFEDGPAWELAGGVLAQSSGLQKVCFHQLGSTLRSIPRKTWETQLDFNCRDFSIDPAQDLLVAICQPPDQANR